MADNESQSLNDLYLLIGRLEGKVDRVLVEQQNIKAMATSNDARIQRLEKDRAMVYGSAAVLAFVGSGTMCGFAAAVYLGQAGQIQATAATGFELKVIAAVVLGGTSIAGGRGSNFSPVVGALLVGIILNALTLNRVPPYYELFVLGFLILVAVSFDGFRRKLLEKEV